MLTPTQIRLTRLAMGMTMREASQLVGVNERSWRRWEAGDQACIEPISRLIVAMGQVPGLREFLQEASEGDTPSQVI